jgi:RyR domain
MSAMTPMSDEQRIETIAKCCHEANRAYSEAHGEESLSWDLARESAMDGVKVALNGATAQEQHEAWCDYKLADGWVYGPVKDPDKKTHPCLVAYVDLPQYQQTKDGLFQAIVFSLAPALGLGSDKGAA